MASSRNGALSLILGGLLVVGCPGPEPSSSNGPTGDAPSGSGGASSSGGGAAGGVMNEGGTNEGGAIEGPGGGGAGGCGVTDFDVNPEHCGECFRKCDGAGVEEAVCKQGLCESTCKSGFLNIEKPNKSMPDDGCETVGLRVFLSASAVEPVFPSGALGADELCQEFADLAGLQGNWRAYLTDSQSGPGLRFDLPPNTVPYYRLDNEKVVPGWSVLADVEFSQLDNPINVTEYKLPPPGEELPVWIGAKIVGNQGNHYCNDWTPVPTVMPPKLPAFLARVGDFSRTDVRWANNGPIPCASVDLDGTLSPNLGRLYCVEQAPMGL
jgi:hypothetical protein